MTRAEFIAQWDGASAADRYAAFLAWIDAEVAPVEDLVPGVQITQNPAASPVTIDSPSAIEVDPGIFAEATPATALAVGDEIIWVVFQTAMKEHNKQIKEQEEYEKDYRKQRNKKFRKLVKDAKIKGSKAGYGDYLYYKLMKELEYGST